MTKRERIEAALSGRSPDRIPITFWHHFPEADHDADRLAEATVNFQQAYDLDLIKLMPNGEYGTEDFGCAVGDPEPQKGSRRVVESPITQPADWLNLVVPDITRGARGRELRCLRLVRAALGPNVPILQTVFSPLSTAAKMLPEADIVRMLRTQGAAIHAGLETITRTEEGYVDACMRAGADGIFFATQLAERDRVGSELYMEFGIPYDRRVLSALGAGTRLSMVHVHGFDILFDAFLTYACGMINWHDRRTVPDLLTARRRFPGTVVGGLDEWGVLLDGPATAVDQDVRAVISRTQGAHHVLGPGCSLPLAVPRDHLLTARGAVETGAA
jgi:uroporphyrinogen decarboxylase